MIEIRGLTKTFRTQRVLDNVDLDIARGRITIVMGPTGTGKSVLLKHVLGLLRPDSGRILVDGRDIISMDEEELTEVRKTYGVCFQDAALFDSMTVGENVAFPFTIHTRMSQEAIRRQVATLLREVGLAGIEEKMPSQISGGMRKRVGLARALALSPDVLLFDEPTAGLDPVMTTAINTLIKQVQTKTRATCLVISHDIQGAFWLADYMALLFNGRIAFYGTPDDCRDTDDELVRQFVEGRLTGPINPIQ
jgi:phospholipid/cholesterol/gamma-HCH transport system ATP-binding protein